MDIYHFGPKFGSVRSIIIQYVYEFYKLYIKHESRIQDLFTKRFLLGV